MAELGETKFTMENVGDAEYIKGKIDIVEPIRDPKVGLFVETTTEQLKKAVTLKG